MYVYRYTCSHHWNALFAWMAVLPMLGLAYFATKSRQSFRLLGSTLSKVKVYTNYLTGKSRRIEGTLSSSFLNGLHDIGLLLPQ